MKSFEYIPESDLFVEVSVDAPCTSKEEAQKNLLHRSEIVENHSNPAWRKFSLPFTKLEKIPRLVVTVFDWDSIGKRNFVGFCQVDVKNLLMNQEASLELAHRQHPDKFLEKIGRIFLRVSPVTPDAKLLAANFFR
jgi:Ca2+-dependent lipid-binding protein